MGKAWSEVLVCIPCVGEPHLWTPDWDYNTCIDNLNSLHTLGPDIVQHPPMATVSLSQAIQATTHIITSQCLNHRTSISTALWHLHSYASTNPSSLHTPSSVVCQRFSVRFADQEGELEEASSDNKDREDREAEPSMPKVLNIFERLDIDDGRLFSCGRINCEGSDSDTGNTPEEGHNL